MNTAKRIIGDTEHTRTPQEELESVPNVIRVKPNHSNENTKDNSNQPQTQSRGSAEGQNEAEEGIFRKVGSSMELRTFRQDHLEKYDIYHFESTADYDTLLRVDIPVTRAQAEQLLFSFFNGMTLSLLQMVLQYYSIKHREISSFLEMRVEESSLLLRKVLEKVQDKFALSLLIKKAYEDLQKYLSVYLFSSSVYQKKTLKFLKQIRIVACESKLPKKFTSKFTSGDTFIGDILSRIRSTRDMEVVDALSQSFYQIVYHLDIDMTIFRSETASQPVLDKARLVHEGIRGKGDYSLILLRANSPASPGRSKSSYKMFFGIKAIQVVDEVYFKDELKRTASNSNYKEISKVDDYVKLNREEKKLINSLTKHKESFQSEKPLKIKKIDPNHGAALIGRSKRLSCEHRNSKSELREEKDELLANTPLKKVKKKIKAVIQNQRLKNPPSASQKQIKGRQMSSYKNFRPANLSLKDLEDQNGSSVEIAENRKIGVGEQPDASDAAPNPLREFRAALSHKSLSSKSRNFNRGVKTMLDSNGRIIVYKAKNNQKEDRDASHATKIRPNTQKIHRSPKNSVPRAGRSGLNFFQNPMQGRIPGQSRSRKNRSSCLIHVNIKQKENEHNKTDQNLQSAHLTTSAVMTPSKGPQQTHGRLPHTKNFLNVCSAGSIKQKNLVKIFAEKRPKNSKKGVSGKALHDKRLRRPSTSQISNLRNFVIEASQNSNPGHGSPKNSLFGSNIKTNRSHANTVGLDTSQSQSKTKIMSLQIKSKLRAKLNTIGLKNGRVTTDRVVEIHQQLLQQKRGKKKPLTTKNKKKKKNLVKSFQGIIHEPLSVGGGAAKDSSFDLGRVSGKTLLQRKKSKLSSFREKVAKKAKCNSSRVGGKRNGQKISKGRLQSVLDGLGKGVGGISRNLTSGQGLRREEPPEIKSAHISRKISTQAPGGAFFEVSAGWKRNRKISENCSIEGSDHCSGLEENLSSASKPTPDIDINIKQADIKIEDKNQNSEQSTQKPTTTTPSIALSGQQDPNTILNPLNQLNDPNPPPNSHKKKKEIAKVKVIVGSPQTSPERLKAQQTAFIQSQDPVKPPEKPKNLITSSSPYFGKKDQNSASKQKINTFSTVTVNELGINPKLIRSDPMGGPGSISTQDTRPRTKVWKTREIFFEEVSQMLKSMTNHEKLWYNQDPLKTPNRLQNTKKIGDSQKKATEATDGVEQNPVTPNKRFSVRHGDKAIKPVNQNSSAKKPKTSYNLNSRATQKVVGFAASNIDELNQRRIGSCQDILSRKIRSKQYTTYTPQKKMMPMSALSPKTPRRKLNHPNQDKMSPTPTKATTGLNSITTASQQNIMSERRVCLISSSPISPSPVRGGFKTQKNLKNPQNPQNQPKKQKVMVKDASRSFLQRDNIFFRKESKATLQTAKTVQKLKNSPQIHKHPASAKQIAMKAKPSPINQSRSRIQSHLDNFKKFVTPGYKKPGVVGKEPKGAPIGVKSNQNNAPGMVVTQPQSEKQIGHLSFRRDVLSSRHIPGCFNGQRDHSVSKIDTAFGNVASSQAGTSIRNYGISRIAGGLPANRGRFLSPRISGFSRNERLSSQMGARGPNFGRGVQNTNAISTSNLSSHREGFRPEFGVPAGGVGSGRFINNGFGNGSEGFLYGFGARQRGVRGLKTDRMSHFVRGSDSVTRNKRASFRAIF